jgi:hypothetical protein
VERHAVLGIEEQAFSFCGNRHPNDMMRPSFWSNRAASVTGPATPLLAAQARLPRPPLTGGRSMAALSCAGTPR